MTLAPLLSGFVALCCIGGGPDRPPPLTFDKHVDYVAWFNEQLRRGKTENALPIYMELCPDESGRGGMPKLEGDAKKEWDRLSVATWKAEDFPAFASYLQRCAPFLDTLRKATDAKYFWQPIASDATLLDGYKLSTLDHSRLAAKMTIVRAWMKGENQAEAIMDAHRIVLRAADHAQQNGSTLWGLVNIGERALVYKSVRAGLGEGILTGKKIRKTFRTLRKYDPGPPDWNLMLSFEWAVQLDGLQQIVMPDGRVSVDGWQTFRRFLGGLVSDADTAAIMKMDARATRTLIDSLNKELQNIVSGPVDVKKRDQMREWETSNASRIRENVLVRKLFPGLSRAYELTLRVESERRGTMLTLAINAHHTKHGEWPKSLKGIDKKLGLKGLKKLRRDPFSGKSFKYRLKDGKPLLYTIGADGVDDGGRHEPDEWGGGEGGGDFVFWPRLARRP